MNAPTKIDDATREAYRINERAKAAALPHGIAGPHGCEDCGNTVVIRGYDCWACETAFDAPVRDTAALAANMARALVIQMAAERSAS